MNTVQASPKKREFEWTGKPKDLTGGYFRESRTAFIGKCGAGDDEELYLVTYDCIVKAKEPKVTWAYKGCEVKVTRFVDVNIIVVERKKR